MGLAPGYRVHHTSEGLCMESNHGAAPLAPAKALPAVVMAPAYLGIGRGVFDLLASQLITQQVALKRPNFVSGIIAGNLAPDSLVKVFRACGCAFAGNDVAVAQS